MSAPYTCITCHVAFWDADIQREHYKTDWHRYNLKRKVAELPPVTAENFNQRVLVQRAQAEVKEEETDTYCICCQKRFKTKKAFENHASSKRHQEHLLKYEGKHKGNDVEELNKKNLAKNMKSTCISGIQVNSSHGEYFDQSKSKVQHKKNNSSDSAAEEVQMEVEEVDSDEWDEFDGDPIPVTDCLFCLHHSGTLEKNVKHMTDVHSFFIPDIDYLVDMLGLLIFLGEKVGKGNMCLWCCERGKRFYSVEAVQNHMLDKGHTKMLHEGDALAEYADFYDYSMSYPDAGEPDEEVDIPVLDGTGYELVLPSGATIGHRSLMKYYRQNLNPVRAIQPQVLHRVLSHYKALGWVGTVGESTAKKARDIRYMQKARAKQQLRLEVKANKLQKHFRRQNP